MSSLHRRLADVAAAVEAEHSRELNSLHDRLNKADHERMQAQVAALRLEATVHEATDRRAELEREMDEMREENARLRNIADERSVEAAQLARINDLSRELIATRFELAAATAKLPPAEASTSEGRLLFPGGTSGLGLDSLLGAASRLDLLAADAILNPACILTRPSSERAGAAEDAEEEEEGGADETKEGSGGEDTPDKDAEKPKRGPVTDPLASNLSRALLAVTLPKETTTTTKANSNSSSSAAAVTRKSPTRRLSKGKNSGSPSSATSPSPEKDGPTTTGTDGPAEEEENDPAERQRKADASCALIEALLLRGAKVNASGNNGRTPLHGACAQRQPMAAALLLQHGAEVDALDTHGSTPMHLAAEADSGEIIQMLMRHGADDTITRASDGATAGQLAAAAFAGGGGSGGGGGATSSSGDGDALSAAAALGDNTLRLSSMARRASQFYRNGEFGSAAKTFEAALEVASKGGDGTGNGHAAPVCSNADIATLHFNWARAAMKEAKHVTALEQSTKALDIKPDYANAAMLQAECFMELLDFENAASAYRRVCALEPENPAWSDCAARASSMASATAYEILGVKERAETGEIKRAYHTQCLQWHPDKHQGSAEDKRKANTMFQRVTGAYELLCDVRKRAELDAKLRTDAALRHYKQQHQQHQQQQAAAAAAAYHHHHHHSSSASSARAYYHHQPTDDENYDPNYETNYHYQREPNEPGLYEGPAAGVPGFDAHGSYGGGGHDSQDEGFGEAEDLRPPSYGWRWPSSASPWFMEGGVNGERGD